MKLKPSNFRLLRRNVRFLGHILTPEKVAIGVSKIHDVVEWPIPKRLKDVRSFIGLCSYYRRFIRDFSVLAAPLFDLTKTGKVFVLDEECQIRRLLCDLSTLTRLTVICLMVYF